jgi:hypothetical protein
MQQHRFQPPGDVLSEQRRVLRHANESIVHKPENQNGAAEKRPLNRGLPALPPADLFCGLFLHRRETATFFLNCLKKE